MIPSSVRPSLIAIALAILCIGLGRPALGAEAEAEVLFARGLQSMRRGEFQAACPALAESYELEPLPGVMFTLAECEAAWGKLATAIRHYESFLSELPSMAPDRRETFDERRRLALEKLTALGAIVPMITIEVAREAPPKLVVKLDDATVTSSSFGVGRPVDPGDYVVTAEVAGQKPWKRQLTVAEREHARIEVPWPLHPAAREPPARPPSRKPVVAQRTPPDGSDRSLTTWKYVAGGIGVAGLATSMVAGAIALGKKSVIEENCPDDLCNTVGRRAVTSGQRAALVSTVSFAVGLAGAAGFVALAVFFQPASTERQALSRVRYATPAGPLGEAGITLAGSF
ncbi:MAG: hypothetical protein JW940_13535 [Polyangiaceae bacterium]|nr:hypothetical protein [Polyangiaceae bacterium]